MAGKNSFLNWVGFKGEEDNAPSSVDRIRELEAQLADLRSRRDITALSKEEFEILATETAMSIIKSAQARESKAQNISNKLVAETNRTVKEEIETADAKARSILHTAELRGRKYLEAAEREAADAINQAEIEGQAIVDAKRHEVSTITSTARRQGEKLVNEAINEVARYRQWLSGVMGEAERLYKVQTQSLDAAQSAIDQSRIRLDSAFTMLAELHHSVIENLNADNTVIDTGPIRVSSQRTKSAISAPRKKAAKKAATKKPKALK